MAAIDSLLGLITLRKAEGLVLVADKVPTLLGGRSGEASTIPPLAGGLLDVTVEEVLGPEDVTRWRGGADVERDHRSERHGAFRVKAMQTIGMRWWMRGARPGGVSARACLLLLAACTHHAGATDSSPVDCPEYYKRAEIGGAIKSEIVEAYVGSSGLRVLVTLTNESPKSIVLRLSRRPGSPVDAAWFRSLWFTQGGTTLPLAMSEGQQDPSTTRNYSDSVLHPGHSLEQEVRISFAIDAKGADVAHFKFAFPVVDARCPGWYVTTASHRWPFAPDTPLRLE